MLREYPTIEQVRITLNQRSNWAGISTAVATAQKELIAITETCWSKRSRVHPNENLQGRFEQMARQNQAHFTPISIESM
jgi:hypothetical protein